MHVMEIENTFPVPKMKSPAMAANDSWMPSKKKSHGSKTSLTSSKENVFNSFPLDKIQVSGQQMHTPRVGNGDDRHDFSNSYNMVKKSNSEGPGSLTTVSYAIPPVKEVLSLQGLKELIKGVGFSNIPVQHPEMVRQGYRRQDCLLFFFLHATSAWNMIIRSNEKKLLYVWIPIWYMGWF